MPPALIPSLPGPNQLSHNVWLTAGVRWVEACGKRGRSHWRQSNCLCSPHWPLPRPHMKAAFSKTLSPMLKRTTAQPVPTTNHPLLWSPHCWISVVKASCHSRSHSVTKQLKLEILERKKQAEVDQQLVSGSGRSPRPCGHLGTWPIRWGWSASSQLHETTLGSGSSQYKQMENRK